MRPYGDQLVLRWTPLTSSQMACTTEGSDLPSRAPVGSKGRPGPTGQKPLDLQISCAWYPWSRSPPYLLGLWKILSAWPMAGSEAWGSTEGSSQALPQTGQNSELSPLLAASLSHPRGLDVHKQASVCGNGRTLTAVLFFCERADHIAAVDKAQELEDMERPG